MLLQGNAIAEVDVERFELKPQDTTFRAFPCEHHDTNAAYATELINDAELIDFTRRTLAFIRRAFVWQVQPTKSSALGLLGRLV